MAFRKVGLALSLIAGSAVLAQDHQVITRSDDGSEPQVLHFSMPDFIELREPDFVQRDLPIFVEKLVLSTEQTAVVQRHIEEYLEAFKKLIGEHLPQGDGMMKIALGPDGQEGPGLMVVAPDQELGEIGEMVQGEFSDEMPAELGMDVRVRIGGTAPVEPDEEMPEGGVAVKIGLPEGEELSPEMRKKLEEAAAKIAEEMRAKLEKQLADGDGGMLPPREVSIEDLQKRQADLAAKAESMRAAKTSLRQTFITTLQTTVLTEEQIERWPALERTLRREKNLPKGRLSGERTNLVGLLKDFELTEAERAAIAPHLDAYELAMDNALRQRDEFLPGSQAKIHTALQHGDADKALTLVDRATSLRVAVRSLNEQYGETISLSLPEAKASEFRAQLERTSFPSVYRTTHGQKVFAASRKIEGLQPETLQSILELEKAYEVELRDHNAQLRQTLVRNEPLEPRRRMEQLGRVVLDQEHPGDVFADEDKDPDPIRTAFAKRRELDERYAKLIESMLPPDQAAQLPKRAAAKRAEPVMIRLPVQPIAQ